MQHLTRRTWIEILTKPVKLFKDIILEELFYFLQFLWVPFQFSFQPFVSPNASCSLCPARPQSNDNDTSNFLQVPLFILHVHVPLNEIGESSVYSLLC